MGRRVDGRCLGRLKGIEVAQDITLDLGVSINERAGAVRHPLLEAAPTESDANGFLLYRTLLHASLRPRRASGGIIEFEDAWETGRSPRLLLVDVYHGDVGMTQSFALDVSDAREALTTIGLRWSGAAGPLT